MHLRIAVAAAAVVLFGFASLAQAQPGRGGGFGGGFGGGGSTMLFLLRVEAVQKELKLSEDQIEQINGVLEGLRGNRAGGDRGDRQRPQGDDAAPRRRRPQAEDESRATAANGTQFVALLQDEAQDDRRARFEEMRREAEARQKEAMAKIEKILKPEQLSRLKGIYIQVAGAGALSDPVIAKDIGITEDQQEEMATIRQESFAGIRELFQGGDRDAVREKMAELREEVNKKTMAVLTKTQQDKLNSLKGEKFELPEGALRGGGGAGGQRGRQRPDA